jgi:hypothetical protein
VRAFAAENQLTNILCLPYQSLDDLAGVLSAADLHAVVMGDQFVGIVHPCKIYNVLAVGSPFLYIGPEESHIADIARSLKTEGSALLATHGAATLVAELISDCFDHSFARADEEAAVRRQIIAELGSRDTLMPMMIDLLERASAARPIRATAISQSSV